MNIQHPIILLPAVAVVALLSALLWRRARRDRLARPWRASLRMVALLLLACAAGGVLFPSPSGRLARAIVLDRSGSTLTDAAKALAQCRGALRGLRSADLAAIIVFGAAPSVEVPFTPRSGLPPLAQITSSIDERGSNLAAALALARSQFPPGAIKQVVLLSDGRPTTGDAWQQAALAAQHGIRLWSSPVGPAAVRDFRIVSFDTPASLAPGVPVPLRVKAASSQPGPATLEVLDELGQVISSQPLVFDGRSPLRVLVAGPPAAEGLHSFTARLIAPDDVPQNNQRLASTLVGGRSLVCYFAPGEEPRTAGQLLTRHRQVACQIGRLQATPTDLLAADAVVLDNCPIELMSTDFLRSLARAVRDAGCGLVVLGGPDSFGPGGYAGALLEDLLPVRCEPREARGTTLVIALDKSGSMAQPAAGATKLRRAQEAVMAAAAALRAQDLIAVVAFDVDARVPIVPQPPTDVSSLERRLAAIHAGGGTDVTPAIQLALKTAAGPGSGYRHVLLLSDGRSVPFDAPAIGAAYAAAHTTLSVVATGVDADVSALRQLADRAGGQFYRPEDMARLHEIFAREARFPLHELIRRGPTAVTVTGAQVVSGLRELAPVSGYVLTTLKELGEAPVKTVAGAPIVATGRAGLGRVAAITTSADDGWIEPWARSGAYARLITQVVRWAARPPVDPRFEIQAEQRNGTITVQVEASNGTDEADLLASVLGPDGGHRAVTLEQVAPGRYAGAVSAPRPGNHLVRIRERRGATTTTCGRAVFTVQQSREWERIGPDHDLLSQLAAATGGRLLEPGEAVPRDARRASARRPIAAFLVLAALVLVVVDAVIR